MSGRHDLNLDFLMASDVTVGISRPMLADEPSTWELRRRTARALAKAEGLMDSLLNPSACAGLACVYCNRPADDGPMVSLYEGATLFRCSPEMGCLPEALVGIPRCPECGAEFRHQVPSHCPLCGTSLYSG